MQRVWTKVLPLLVVIAIVLVGITHGEDKESIAHAATTADGVQDATISQLIGQQRRFRFRRLQRR